MSCRRIYNVPLLVWILFILSIPLFKFYGHIDLEVSQLFFNNGAFGFKDTLAEQFFHKSVRWFIIAVALGAIALFIYNNKTHKNILHLGKKRLIFILLVLSLTPGLIVNLILKEGCERPRPTQITAFGKNLDFYPAYTCSGQGKDSFSSGHVAAAVSLMGIALLAERRRRFWITITTLYSIGMVYARVAAGGHFLSDALTSFFLVYITNHMLYYFIFDKER